MNRARPESIRRALLVAVVALAAALRLWAVWFGLPLSLARPDETTALGYAVHIAAGDPNPHFFNWPSLNLYVLAAICAVAAPIGRLMGAGDAAADFAHLVVPARVYIAMAGTLTVFVVYQLARQVTSRGAATAAALFLAVAPLHVRDSHFVATDVPMTLLVTLSLWLLLCAARRSGELEADAAGRRRRSATSLFALAGGVAGLATATKYNAAIVIVAAVWAQVRQWRRTGGRFEVQAAAPLAAFAACMAGGFLVGTPFSILDFPKFQRDVLAEAVHLSSGHGPALGPGWLHHLAFSLPSGLGIGVFLAAVAGAIVAVRSPWRRLAIVAAFAIAYYAFMGRGATVFARYVLPVLPVLSLLAAIGVDGLAALAARRFGWQRRRVFVAAIGLVALPSLINSVWLVALLGRTDSRVIAGRWLTSHLPADSTLAETGREYVRLRIESPRLHRWDYDPALGHFAGATSDMLPQWLVLHRSANTLYASVPPPIDRLVRTRYRLVKSFIASSDQASPTDYDRQDAFFLPLRGFRHVVRPGTNIFVYTLSGAGLPPDAAR